MSQGAALLTETRASDDASWLLDALDDAIARAASALAPACGHVDSWRDRIRVGISGLLALAESDPDLAWAWAVTLPRHRDPRVRQRLADFDGLLLAAIAEASADREARFAGTQPMAEWALDAARHVVAERLEQEERPPLMDLTGPLTALVGLPFLGLEAMADELSVVAPAFS